MEKLNYQGKNFRVLTNSANGEVSSAMVFHYEQQENILTCTYSGENIRKGHLIGIVAEDGSIDMRYHQVNRKGELLTGICRSMPEWSSEGILRLREKWQWTSGDFSAGESILEEV